MANEPAVVADPSIATPSQETLDGILNGAGKLGTMCKDTILDTINAIVDKIEEINKKKDKWIREIKAYANDKKKQAEKIAEVKKKLAEELEPLQKQIDEVEKKLDEYKKIIKKKLEEIYPKPIDKIAEKMGPPISILWNFFQNGISISLSLSCITQIVDALMAVIEFLIQPYIQYIKLVKWWGTNGPKILSYMQAQITIVTEALNNVTKIKTALSSLMVLNV